MKQQKKHRELASEAENETEKAKNKIEETVSALDVLKDNIEITFKKDGKQAVDNFGNEVENSFMRMVDTGKFNFKQLGDSVIKELQRMMIRALIVKPIIDSLTSAFGLGDSPNANASAAPKATGGPVIGGQSYLIGEKGPELFTPSTSGNITPNNRLGGGGSPVQVNVINNSGENDKTETRDEGGDKILDVIIGQAKAAISDDISRGTGVARVLEGKYGLNRKSF
ncbi:hypothetical protein JK628_23080 (plasmid) [Shewanella sp. KX20019]|uniref:phage tail tape measure C-terminal domain-containing protein n=1 Tax=Shewanella sp. KX20019 TaxID=2803864 RepID=UPI001928F790|nr:phage tail tape measure C-terminal domain-containing protein [Shewanella sp. KX20019]QQX82698.1 hypothetical protein JK628_23080 [Shewanella sp. KX20019]